jgi:hypothetical protein
VRIGRPEAATVIDGWLQTQVKSAIQASQPTLDQLDELIDRTRFPTARSRGASMSSAELTKYLDHELTSLVGDDNADSA